MKTSQGAAECNACWVCSSVVPPGGKAIAADAMPTGQNQVVGMPSGHDHAIGVFAKCRRQNRRLAPVSIGVGQQPNQIGGFIADQDRIRRQTMISADFFAQALAAAVRVTRQK